jgi:hypothetical protein
MIVPLQTIGFLLLPSLLAWLFLDHKDGSRSLGLSVVVAKKMMED